MTHGHVPVCRHYREEDTTGELVDAGGGHVDLAHDVPERPQLQVHRGDQERNSDEKTLVCYGQVDDVHVGDGLHLAEPQHDVDDQRVPEQSHYADRGVQHLSYEVQSRLVCVAVELRLVSRSIAVQ